MSEATATLSPPVIAAAELSGIDEPGSPVPLSASGPARLLLFTLAGSAWCIAAEAVREVVQPLPCPPVPGVPSFVRGAAALRGEVLTVIDLAALLGLPQARTTGGRAKLIVLRSGGAGADLAFEADDAIAVVGLQGRTFRPASRPFVDGEMITDSGDVCGRIDTAALDRLLHRT